MKKLNLSRFDLGVIIGFVVITLIGVGLWWYLSGELQDAQAADATAKSDFDKYSTKFNLVVSPSNGKTLQANIDLIKAQLDPLIETKLKPKENKLSGVGKEDPVAWKHDLDDKVNGLKTAAKLHSVKIPSNFYFGFSRYLGQSPSDEQTAVLSKQLLDVEQLASILINAPVRDIQAINRTYEEDPHTTAGAGSDSTGETDHLGGYSIQGAGNAYTAYPFELVFEATSENLRTVMNGLLQSPYVFVVRTISIESSKLDSPTLSDLDRLAGPPDSSIVNSAPGEVANRPTKGPQFIFGNSVLTVHARIDMIEWKAEVKDTTTDSGPATKNPHLPGGSR